MPPSPIRRCPRGSRLRGMECYCCGEDRDPSIVTSLSCHDEVKICRICVGWLSRRVGAVDVSPTLPVKDMNEAIAFYEAAGFEIEPYDDGFAFVHIHDQPFGALDLAEGMDPAANHAGCYVVAEEVDDWHDRLAAGGLHVAPAGGMAG